MAPRPAPPPRGGRVRRVSLLIDLGGGSVGDHHHVRLLVRRLLSHFSRQRPAPPRWCVRFYDSGLSPHAFDAKLRARADERAARHAEEEERERERNATDSRVHSWVDEHTRETAGVGSLRVVSGKDAGSRARLGGASEAVRATRYRDFGACDANAAEAFLKHHDEAFALYHEHHRSSSHRTHSGARRPTDRTQTETRGAETAERATAAEVDEKNQNASAFVDESGWFTTLARQMAATLHESGSGNGACGVETHAERERERDPRDSHDVMLVLARAGIAPANVATKTKGSTGGPPRAFGPSAVALAAATEEKQRENVARAFKGIEAALRKERTVAHLLRLPFGPGFPSTVEDPASRSKNAGSGGFSDVSSASVEKAEKRRKTRTTETMENGQLRAFSLATRSAWRRATALFSGFGGCALPAALVAHAAAHVAPCALMAAAADAAAKALEEREKFSGASFPTRDENKTAFSSLALALAHDDDHDVVGDLAGDILGDGAGASARVRVREGALESEDPSDFPFTKTSGKTRRTITTTRRAAEETSVSPQRRTETTVSLGVAALVPVGDGENDARVDDVAKAFSRAPRAANDDLVADGEGAARRGETSSRTTVTIEALVALDDDTHLSATFGDARDDSLVLVPRANDDALGGLAALLALRGVAAVAEVTEWTIAKPATTVTKSENDASADASEEELDVMATQEEANPEAETSVVANRRLAILRPLFARALSLRFVDGPRKEARVIAAGTEDDFPRREKNARFVSGGGAAARALAAAARLDAAEWGCVESIVDDAAEDDIVGARSMLAPSLADELAADAPDHLSARPFAFASSPEYKPARSRGVLALPPGTHPGAPRAEGNGDRAASVSGDGETCPPRTDLAHPIRLDADVSLADAFVEAANAAPAGTHRWEAWYGDGPGVGASVAERFRVSPRAADGVLPDASAFSPLRLPAPALDGGKAADVEGSFARRSRNADVALAARFDAMVSGRPAPANALPGAGAPASPSTLSRDTADSRDADSGSGSVGKTALKAGSREGREAASEALALALVPAEAAPATYPLAALPDVDAADVDAVAARVAAAYKAVASAYLGAPADAPDPDAGEAAAALASKAAAAFARALRRGEGGGEGGDEIAAASSAATTKRACDLATRALCVTAKDLRASHSGIAGAAAKAAKRREHLLQAHLRLACAALAPAPPSPSASAKLAKTVAKLVGAVTFLLTPVGAEGVRRFVDRELAPRYAGENVTRNSKLIAAVRAELGVGAGADADAAGATPHARRGAAAAVFSPAAPAQPAQAPLPRLPAEAGHLNVSHSHGDVAASARGAARLGPPAAAALLDAGAKGWHPVFRSRSTRARRQVTMPDPARAAAERAREAEREAERRTKSMRERAAASAALIERDGAIGRSRLRDGGKRAARLASAALGQPGSMPAPRRLAREFGSGNDDVLETPARADAGAAVPGGRSVDGSTRFGSTAWAPRGGGLETPAVARTRVAATPVAARGVNVNARAGLSLRRGARVPESATVVAATPIPQIASRVAETPAVVTARAIVGTAGIDVDSKTRFRETTTRKTSPNVSKNVSALGLKRRAGSNKPGLASFGAMVREGRELAETERGGGAKRARR